MTNKFKTIYAVAAEVVGMVLAYLAEKEKETEGPFHTYIESCLSKVKPDSFIVCVHHMHRHYPPIADRYEKRQEFCVKKGLSALSVPCWQFGLPCVVKATAAARAALPIPANVYSFLILAYGDAWTIS